MSDGARVIEARNADENVRFSDVGELFADFFPQDDADDTPPGRPVYGPVISVPESLWSGPLIVKKKE
jgi:hypothetical protein